MSQADPGASLTVPAAEGQTTITNVRSQSREQPRYDRKLRYRLAWIRFLDLESMSAMRSNRKTIYVVSWRKATGTAEKRYLFQRPAVERQVSKLSALSCTDVRVFAGQLTEISEEFFAGHAPSPSINGQSAPGWTEHAGTDSTDRCRRPGVVLATQPRPPALDGPRRGVARRPLWTSSGSVTTAGLLATREHGFVAEASPANRRGSHRSSCGASSARPCPLTTAPTPS
jgi:hypothetical protein